MNDYISLVNSVSRERKTEDEVRALDAADIVEWIHRLEDSEEALTAQAERLREALTAFVCNSSVQVNFPSECEEAEAALAEIASDGEVSDG